MADHLVAWLHETPTAVLTPGPEFRITLEWRAEAVERWGAGSPALSVGLPIGAVIGPRDMRGLDFFGNVLPEGPTLQRMAAIAGVRPADTYGILKAFGRDCAGAIQVLPEGEEPGTGDEDGYRVMSSEDLRRVIGALDVAPLGVAPERGFRPSLAGCQRKALLGRAADGSPRPAGWRRRKGNCSTSRASRCWRFGGSTGRSAPAGGSRSGFTRKTAAKRPLRDQE